MKNLLVVSSISILFALLSCGQRNNAEENANKSISRTYTTNFPFNENPISEGDMWINGADDGMDWGNVATERGIAYGLQDGAIHYADGTAILRGPWWPDQTVEATIYIGVTDSKDFPGFPEVELRLRSSLSAHNCTGYEVLWGVDALHPYFSIVRWNGARGDFTYLYDRDSAGYGSHNQYAIRHGDVVKATIVGNVITAYLNGVQKARVTDGTFMMGNPGMGFNYICRGDCTSPHDGYGFARFSATDELKPPSHSQNMR